MNVDDLKVAGVVISGRGGNTVGAMAMDVPVAIHASDGDDSVFGGNVFGRLHGDMLWPDGGRDRLLGDDRNDALAGGGSTDTLDSVNCDE